jgi:hypothetical protein
MSVKLSAVRWLFSPPAAMFYCLAASGMHESVGSPPGIPALAAILASYLLACIIALWVLTDARQRRRPLPYDFGSFVFFAWWALAPIYLFSTRGWRGFIPFGWFILLYLAAVVVGSIPVWLPATPP